MTFLQDKPKSFSDRKMVPLVVGTLYETTHHIYVYRSGKGLGEKASTEIPPKSSIFVTNILYDDWSMITKFLCKNTILVLL